MRILILLLICVSVQTSWGETNEELSLTLNKIQDDIKGLALETSLQLPEEADPQPSPDEPANGCMTVDAVCVPMQNCTGGALVIAEESNTQNECTKKPSHVCCVEDSRLKRSFFGGLPPPHFGGHGHHIGPGYGGGGYASGFPAFDDYGSYGRRGKFGAYDYYDYDDGYGRGRGRQARRRGHRNDGYGDDIYPDDYSYEESSEEYFDYEDYGGRGGGRRGGRGRHRGRGNRNNGRQEQKAGNNRRNEPPPRVVAVPVPITGYPDPNQAYRQIQLPLAVPSAFGRAAQPLQPFDVTTLNDLGSSQTTSQQVVPYAPWQVPLALRTGYQNSQAQTTGLIQEPPGAVLSSLLRSQGPTTTQFQQIPSYEPQQQTLLPSYFTPQPLQNPPNFQPTQPGRLLPGLSVSNYRL